MENRHTRTIQARAQRPTDLARVMPRHQTAHATWSLYEGLLTYSLDDHGWYWPDGSAEPRIEMLTPATVCRCFEDSQLTIAGEHHVIVPKRWQAAVAINDQSVVREIEACFDTHGQYFQVSPEEAPCETDVSARRGGWFIPLAALNRLSKIQFGPVFMGRTRPDVDACARRFGWRGETPEAAAQLS